MLPEPAGKSGNLEHRPGKDAGGYDRGIMRIAKPILLVSTPIGVVFGLVEAWKVGAWLGWLMLALIGVISGFAALTVRRIRTDRDLQQARPDA